MTWYKCLGDTNKFKFPSMVYSESTNRSDGRTIFYNFDYTGKYQYCVVIKAGDIAPAVSDVVIYLDEEVLSPRIYNYSSYGYIFLYGEIEVSGRSQLTVVPTVARENSGLLLHVMQNADVNNFTIVSVIENNSFDTISYIDPDYICLEVYNMGYHNGANHYSYQFIYHTEWSIPVPDLPAYYYGGNYVIKVV